MSNRKPFYCLIVLLTICSMVLVGCLPPDMVMGQSIESTPLPAASAPEMPLVTPLPTRPAYSPGELVDYIAQTGDTLPAIAAHFNTSVAEIRAANTFIPDDATTMPPGMPMKIPIYFQALWGSPYQILPDSHYINGPAGVDFDLVAFAASQPGWFKDYSEYVQDRDMSGPEFVNVVATNFSVSPRLLAALLEFYLGAFSNPVRPEGLDRYPLGIIDTSATGVYRQLNWIANHMNNGYYQWREGRLGEIILADGSMLRPDPWQNAATIALQYFFALNMNSDEFNFAVSSDGLANTYRILFGDPWSTPPHLPGSLRQPEYRLPFAPGRSWSYTGGPHNPWGDGSPFAAIDFAPPSVSSGCTDSDEFVTAVTDGVIVRTGTGTVVLDTDGDGDERTGWVIFHLHLASRDRISQGATVKAGDNLGHPSCEGGKATGTHVHIARKYNGEWIHAGGIIPFTLDGWVARDGTNAYLGSLIRQGRIVEACTCSDQNSQLQADFR